MKLIIDISDELYNHIKYFEPMPDELMRSVENGIPLPEHHGRLISEEDMLSVIMFSKLFDDAKVGEVKEALLNIPTIIKRGDNNDT